MAQIIKFPAPASKFGYRRVKRRAKAVESPDQLHLFPQQTAKILPFSAGLSFFEQALMLDERDDAHAEEFYTRAIEANDCPADAHCNLGIIRCKQGNLAGAFDSFTTSLKLNPRHFESHYNLGNIYFDVGDYRLAQVHYQIAAEIEPLFPNVYFNLALVLAINNDLAGAVSALSRYQRMVPENEGRNANELLESLRRSLGASKSGKAGFAT
jgi:tetratricopeptide (TPR) repeat protein